MVSRFIRKGAEIFTLPFGGQTLRCTIFYVFVHNIDGHITQYYLLHINTHSAV